MEDIFNTELTPSNINCVKCRVFSYIKQPNLRFTFPIVFISGWCELGFHIAEYVNMQAEEFL